MVCQAILHHGQDIEGRVGEVLKPLTTPVHWMHTHTKIEVVVVSSTTLCCLSFPTAIEVMVEYSHKMVASISKETSWLFCNIFTKGNTSPGR